MDLHWLGWVGLAATMTSTILKARVSRWGWVIGLLGCLLWLAAYPHDQLIRTNNLIFSALYVYGWLRWGGYSFSGIFAWYDAWVGIFWDRKKRWLYVLPIPMCGIIVKFPEKKHGQQ